MKLPAAVLAFVGALGLASGCGAASCPTQRITDPAAALRAQRTAANASGVPIRSLRAEAKIDQRSKEGRIKGRILMFVERPDRVRFDAMTQFGPALILTSDGQQFALSDFKDNRYLTGPACAKNLARVVGVALSSAEVASVLLGDAPLLGEGQAGSQQGLTCSGEGQYVLTRKAADGAHEELAFRIPEADLQKAPEAQRLYLAAVTLWDRRGVRLYRVRYEDYRKVSQAELPHTVRIDDFVNDSDALLRLSDVAVDVKVPDGAFVQSPRAGLKVEEVACDQVQ
jgi:outer membrane lipoprotein-sorting protein